MDGAMMATQSSLCPGARGNYPFQIGAMTTSSYFFNGDMAEIQLYNRALNSWEIMSANEILAATYGVGGAAGMVVAWGSNSSGQTNVPAGLTNVVAIAAGSFFSMALRANGTVVVWGSSSFGLTNVPAHLTNVIAIAAGGSSCLAVVGSSPPAWTALAGNAVFTTNVFSFSIPSQGGQIFELDYKNTLKDTNWTGWTIYGFPVVPLAAGTGTNVVLTDSFATNSTRFYRVRKW